MKSAKEHIHGANTFRFFIAIYNGMGGAIDVVQTVQEPITITKLGEEEIYLMLKKLERMKESRQIKNIVPIQRIKLKLSAIMISTEQF